MYPCETFARYILPIFRLLVAKELIEKYNFTQVEAAKKLGTTQAAISQYVHAKRGRKGSIQFEEVLPAVQVEAHAAAKKIAAGKTNADDVMKSFCELCESLREKGKLSKAISG